MTYEILNMEQLDNISGGDRKEYFEIANLLPKIPEKWLDERGRTHHSFRLMTPETDYKESSKI